MGLDLDKIPRELKALPQWVCWSFKERKGKPTKIPKNPKTGGNAKADNPETWGEFGQALRHYEAYRKNGVDGIGFMFSADDPYTGVDIDHCRDPETGQLRYCAQVLIEYLDSYSEASPSGSGIHTITKAKRPENAGNSKTFPCGMKIEIYDRLRYFTMTGHHLEGIVTP
jgi:putative DNA primase/helicase